MGAEAAPGRKEWIENRLREHDQTFAVSVGGFSLMDNHLNLLLRIDPEVALGWSDTEVAERWFKLFPPRGADRKPMPVSKEIMAARLANKQDECTGAFFEGRFKSIAILDEESLLSVCAYIDLNPVAAGVCPTSEESAHTSVKERVDHVNASSQPQDLQAAELRNVAAVRVSE